MPAHKDLTSIHRIYNWSYTDESDRTSATGFVAGDVGKIAKQLDNNTLWQLTATDPVWKQVDSGGTGSIPPFNDTTSIVQDPVDNSKQMRIDVGSVDTSTVRVLTMPNKDVTVDDVADPRTPSAHKSSHVSAGGDAFVSTDLLEAIVKRLQESSGPTTLTLGAVADGQYLKRSGTAVVGDVPVFGTQYQYAASEGESTNATTTPVQKLRLTTPTLPAGNYRIAWFYEWLRDDAANSFEARVQLDDATILATHLTENSDPTNWNPVSGFVQVALTNAVHTIDIDFWGETSTDTSYIRRARIEIWRVS